MIYPISPMVCEVQSPAYGGSATVRDCIESLSTVSSILQCAMLACRSEPAGGRLTDFWCVADCLALAERELWKVVENLERHCSEPGGEEKRIRELMAKLPW